MSATILQFPKRHRFAIVVERESDDGGWLVLRGCFGWLHGSAWRAFEEARELAQQDAVNVVVRL